MIEILENAEFNLNLLGVCIVFTAVVSLLVLLIVIAILGYVSRKKQAVGQAALESSGVSSNVTNLADDLELVAVITAAIAMQEKVSTDSFVVRSIRRRPSNKWS